MNKDTLEQGKITASIAYLTLVGTLIGITMNIEPKNDFARFHLRQAFGVHLFYFVFAIMNNLWGNIYGFYGIWLAYIVLCAYGFLGAINKKYNSVPILGPYFQKWFQFIP